MNNIKKFVASAIVFLIVVQILFNVKAPCKIFDAVWSAGDLLTFVGTITLGILAYWQNEKLRDQNNLLKYTVKYIPGEKATFFYNNAEYRKYFPENFHIESGFSWYRKHTKLVNFQVGLEFILFSDVIPTEILINKIGLREEGTSSDLTTSDDLIIDDFKPIKPLISTDKQNTFSCNLIIADELLENVLSIKNPKNIYIYYNIYFLFKIKNETYISEYFSSQVFLLDRMNENNSIITFDARSGVIDIRNCILQYKGTYLKEESKRVTIKKRVN
ncbi:MAG: hypothetical protein WBI07_07065 [Mobilitalea sp.]